MASQESLVTIHLTNQTSYISTAGEFERFLAAYEESLKATNPIALLKIRLVTPGEDIAIDTAAPFEAYLNPTAIAMVDYL